MKYFLFGQTRHLRYVLPLALGLSLTACSALPSLPGFESKPIAGKVLRDGLGQPILSPAEIARLKKQ